jgi:hypothetical protein
MPQFIFMFRFFFFFRTFKGPDLLLKSEDPISPLLIRQPYKQAKNMTMDTQRTMKLLLIKLLVYEQRFFVLSISVLSFGHNDNASNSRIFTLYMSTCM